MKQLNSHNFKEVYQWLGIDLNKLGCLMLDTEKIILPRDGFTGFPTIEAILYYAKNKDRFWIDGIVCETIPHITLLYGFLTEAKTLQPHIEKVLEGWNFPSVKISEISFFNSPYEDEEYYCIVAKIEVSDELLEGHRRLEFLPHINTFTGYTPHITIAYIKKDETARDIFIENLKKEFVGKELKITGLNYGGNK